VNELVILKKHSVGHENYVQ